jgi:hypothetical protein
MEKVKSVEEFNKEEFKAYINETGGAWAIKAYRSYYITPENLKGNDEIMIYREYPAYWIPIEYFCLLPKEATENYKYAKKYNSLDEFYEEYKKDNVVPKDYLRFFVTFDGVKLTTERIVGNKRLKYEFETIACALNSIIHHKELWEKYFGLE